MTSTLVSWHFTAASNAVTRNCFYLFYRHFRQRLDDTADLIYFVILGGMILGKWLEFRGGCPETSTGERTSAADLRRYILMVVTAGPVVWLIANILGNYVVRR